MGSAAVLTAILTHSAMADEYSAPVRDLHGDLGLIDMPSSRMATDGQLSIGGGFFQNTQHYNFGFQVLPWLEGSFRYSGLEHFDPLYPVYYDRSFAIKARIWKESDLLPEVAIGINDLVGTGVYAGEYVVASKQIGSFDATIGLGWGRLASTRQFSNPLGAISSSFFSRITYPAEAPGGTNFNTFFHGPDAGLFGGVRWTTPIPGFSLVAEYSSDAYTLETTRGSFNPRNQMNFGASYQVTDNFSVGLDWLYGRSIGANFSFQLDPVHDIFGQKLGPEPPPVHVRAPQEQYHAIASMLQSRKGERDLDGAPQSDNMVDALWQQDGLSDVEIRGRSIFVSFTGSNPDQCRAVARLLLLYGSDINTVRIQADGKSTACSSGPAHADILRNAAFHSENGLSLSASLHGQERAVERNQHALEQLIEEDALKQKIKIEGISLTASSALVYYENYRYFSEAEALDRLTRVLMADTPADVENFRFIAVVNGVPQQEFNILRGPVERQFVQSGSLDLFGGVETTSVEAPPMQNPPLSLAEQKSYPRFSWSIFPQLRQQLFDPSNPYAIQLLAGADANLELLPGLSLNGEAEASLYDNFNKNRAPDSSLPHVRSDFLQYFSKGKNGIGDLEIDYRFRVSPSVFAVAKVGYLESMFAGAGGEVLWRPEGQRWALGLDAYKVWQRNFDRLFGLQNYSVFTGHISVYYQSPWYGLNFAVHAGQYLAGDRGLTVEVTRRFETGVEIGAFMTRTNVSAARFGEGSFDKGIIIRIPLGWTLPIETQNQFNLDLRPVQRDGGQRLDGDVTLYEETRRARHYQ
jgi:hypothetical protein